MVAAEGTEASQTAFVDSSSASSLPSPHLLALHRHLSQALLKPVCPDIYLRAFNRIYSTHRIFLVQAIFFHSLLNGDFREAKSSSTSWKPRRSSICIREESSNEDNIVDLYFDDPNITRPAFEYCLATLYGAAPALVLPSWCCPDLDYPLTRHFPSAAATNIEEATPHTSSAASSSNRRQHPATPRFLLSLVATAEYLGIPSVSSQAITLILCSITPFTISHYLHFSLGHGIAGAIEAQERQQERDQVQWDWELEGPAWSLESISRESAMSSPDTTRDDSIDVKVESVVDTDEEEGKAGSDRSPDSPSISHKAAKESKADVELQPASSSDANSSTGLQSRLFYGAQSDKIGEACACWLLRWGADVLLAEEQMQPEEDNPEFPSYTSLFILPKNHLPTSTSSTSNRDSAQIIESLPIPHAAVWCHPKQGGIPADWARAIISSDSFWIRSEWDRYDVARRMVTMRRGYREDFVEAEENLNDVEGRNSIGPSQNEVKRNHEIKDTTKRSRRSSSGSSSTGSVQGNEQDEFEYLQLFSEGIYYTHMTFEELSEISSQTCPRNGTTFVPMHVLQGALWAQSELKNMILSKERGKGVMPAAEVEADETDEVEIPSRRRTNTATSSAMDDPDRELGLVSSSKDFIEARQRVEQRRGRKSDASMHSSPSFSLVLGGMRPLKVLGMTSKTKALENLLEKRFFAVPSDDTVRIGENLSSLVSTSTSNDPSKALHEEGGASGIAAILDHQTLHIAHDTKRASVEDYFGIKNAIRSGSSLGHPQESVASSDWTGYEPMRLGVDFYSVDRLKEKERMYSPSFFYAGSIWNLYLQIIKKPKGPQLGIYLHRQSCHDSLPNPSFPSALPPTDMLADLSIGGAASEVEPRTPARRDASFYTLTSSPGTTTDSTTQMDVDTSTPVAPSAIHTRQRTQHLTTPHHHHHHSASLTPSPTSHCTNNNKQRHQHQKQVTQVNTPYLDQRQILRAYFSVHCPSALGTSMTRFSSRPDNFTLSQSWGWKSSSLLGAVYLSNGQIGSAESKISSVFRCIVTVGVV